MNRERALWNDEHLVRHRAVAEYWDHIDIDIVETAAVGFVLNLVHASVLICNRDASLVQINELLRLPRVQDPVLGCGLLLAGVCIARAV